MAESVRTFFFEFRDLFWFIYGLLFFTIGLTILLQSRHYSRLILTKSLPWLGAFGLVHSAYEWGYLFFPILLDVIGAQYLTVISIIHQIIIAVSFTLLFQFGVVMLRPYRKGFSFIRFLPILAFLVWLVGPFILGFTFMTSLDEWSTFANACARYIICVPGSAFAVTGLIHQQRSQVKPLKLPVIDNVIRVAAGALSAYGVLAGWFVPKTTFFPASVINTSMFEKALIAPVQFYRAIACLILLYSIIRALEIFDYETDELIRNMEERQVINNERERIARDLHDGALQQVYASGLLVQSLKRHVADGQKQEVEQLIDAINQAISQLRGFLPQHKPELTSVDLIGALQPKIEEAQRYIHVDTFWDNQRIPPLTVDQTRHISALAGEAISNAIRHSRSEKIEVAVNCQDNRLVLEVRDFGEGIDPFSEQGYGLKNMRDRARLLGANLTVNSEKLKGTVVKLVMPIEEVVHEH